MSIKLTEKQLQLLINALHIRVSELNDILNPILAELAEHQNFLLEHEKTPLTSSPNTETNQSFEVLPWSKKIIRVLFESENFMTANEIVAEIVKRVPALAEEPSTRSSVASLLSRRAGKLFKKVEDKYGLMEWGGGK